MVHWILLATAWHRDGTPFRHRNLFNSLQNGDPLAIAYTGAALLVIFGPALYRAVQKRSR
jgi:hypothetical protein